MNSINNKNSRSSECSGKLIGDKIIKQKFYYDERTNRNKNDEYKVDKSETKNEMDIQIYAKITLHEKKKLRTKKERALL